MRLFLLLYNYLVNNKRLINTMAESKPIRFAARFVVKILNQTGALNASSKAIENPKEILSVFKQMFKSVADKKNKPQ